MEIYESLLNLDKTMTSSFHVLPIQNIGAIKSKSYFNKYKILMENLSIFEKTATQSFFDSLVLPSNQIKKSMDAVGQIFDSDATFFTTAGSTISNQIAINSLARASRVLVQKSVHQSIHFSLQNYNIFHDYIHEETICNERFLTSISSNQFDKLIQNEYDTLIINSQSYEGLMLDIELFLNYTIQKNKNIKNVIIDDAWGGWTFFNKGMKHKSAPYIAKKLKESIGINIVVIQSAHKSFFSLRQAGIIHVYGDELFVQNIRDSHFKLHTTSPSYPILTSIELGILHARDHGEYHSENAFNLSQKLKDFIKHCSEIFEIDDVNFKNDLYYSDPNKVWIKTNFLTGKELRDVLFYKYGVYLSRYTKKHVLINFHYGVTENCLESLTLALSTIEKKILSNKFLLNENELSQYFVIPYPPGVPLIFPGQKISKSDISNIKKHQDEKNTLIYIKETL